MGLENLVNSPKEWKLLSLGEICKAGGGGIQTGPFGSQLHAADYVMKGIPSIMPKNITVERVDTETIAYISEEDAERLAKYLVQPGDIIYSRRGDVEKCVLVTDREDGWLCGTGCLRIRLGEQSQLSPEYLHAFLAHPGVRDWIARHAIGATMPNLNTSILSELKVAVPRREIQLEIASIWRQLIHKIELNRRMNRTLEEMAQAIFKSWFVDFEPVKAKAAAKAAGATPEAITQAAMAAIAGKTELDFSRLPETQLRSLGQTASFFPDSLQDSEIGAIPEGWEISTIADETETVGGATPSTKNPAFWENGEVPWVTPRDFSALQDKILLSSARKITQKGLKSISSGLLPIDTVLMSSRAPVGYLAISKMETAINQGFIAMKCAGRLSPEYVLQWASFEMDNIKQAAGGSTFAEISKKTFRAFPIIVPPADIVTGFTRVVGSLYNRIASNGHESRTLAELRDTLLPKLLSGTVQIKGSENE